MSEPGKSKSRVQGWGLVLLAAPLIYLLSVPPAYCLVCTTPSICDRPDRAVALFYYCRPYQKLARYAPALRQPLDDYFSWCHEKFLGLPYHLGFTSANDPI
jgi:hypothetical protein